MKALLIILLFVVILLLLYFFVFKKKGGVSSQNAAEPNNFAVPEAVKDHSESVNDELRCETVEEAESAVRAFNGGSGYLTPFTLNEPAIDTANKYKRIIAINLDSPNSSHDKIYNIALTYDEEGSKVSAMQYVDPEADFDRASTLEKFQNAGKCPTFPELWPELAELFEGSLVIAHNTAFDISILKKTLAFYDLPIPNFDVACTYKLSRKFHSELNNFRLATVCDKFGIPVDMDSALSHSNACYEIFRKLMEEGIPVFEETTAFSL